MLGKVVDGRFEVEKGGRCVARVYGMLVTADCPACHSTTVVQLQETVKG